MKKKIAMFLTVALSVSMLAGCGKEANKESDNSASEAVSASADAAITDDASVSTGFTTDFDNLETMSLKDVTVSELVTLGQYTGVSAEAALKEVTEQDIDDYIQNLKASNPPMTEVTDRPVQDGDTVNIDYVGKYADTKEAFDGGTAQGQNLVIGSNSYIEGFESGLIGVNKGETVDLDLTFPENYGAENLAGKAVVFTVTVNSINVAADEITDEWAAGLGREGVSNLAELREYAKNTLTENNKEDYETAVESSVLNAVTSNSTFAEIPEKLVNRYLQQQNQMLQYRANLFTMYYGQQVSAADVVNLLMQNEGFEGSADDYLKGVAKEMAEQYVMFQAIADEQGIEVTDQEIDDYLKEAYESASSTAFSSFEEYKASLDLEVYREGLMSEKVVKYLVDNAVVVPASEDSASEAASTVAK